MSHPWVARHNKNQQRRNAASRREVRIKQLRMAMLLALSGGLLWSMRPVQAAGTPTGLPVAVGGAGFVSYGAANASTVGTAMTVTQTSDKAILNWTSFNIDAGHSVSFRQPGAASVALNRIHDSAPSTIAGNLTANGQIYLINTNGIVFAGTAQVNVNSLTASTLDISDALFKAGILSASQNSTLTPVFSGTGAEGDVTVAANAGITAQSGGRIMLVAPNVHNQGIITAPDGQIILAAGAKVYLQASNDPGLRGLLVEVDNGGAAENLNLGQLLSQHGNITLVGLAVNQSGRVSATTSVNANGSIELLAETDAKQTALTADQGPVVATRTGSVTFGSGSVTEVAPDLNDPTTVVDEQTVMPSKITAVGNTVNVQSNSQITAHSGQVTLAATTDPTHLDAKTQLLSGGSTPDGSRVYVDQGAKIDVSGAQNVVMPMSHNLVQVDLRSNELADSPLQRNGFLYGKTVTVDARVGSPLANVQGAIATIGRSIAERTTTGGTVNLQSTGDVVVKQGATIDVSGGSKQFQGGYLNTTQLISNGVSYDIGSASPDRIYSGIVGVFTKTYTRWNVTESWGTPVPGANSGNAPYIPGYIEGADAGTVNINTFHLVQDGTLLGKAVAGTYQRGVRPADSSQCDLGCQASTTPHGGQLIIGDPGFKDPVTQRQISRIGDILFGSGFAPAGFGLDNGRLMSGDPIPATQLDTAWFESGGFTRLAVYSDGLVSLPQDTTLTTAPGGSVSLTARQIDIAGSIRSPGGSASLGTQWVANEANGSSHDITLENQAQIDVAGLWTNDLPQGQTPVSFTSTAINGGSVTLSANPFGNIDLTSGSRVDVSGGAWMNSGGKLALGNGGTISLNTVDVNASMTVDGTLRGYAPGKGGNLSLTTGSVCIGSSVCSDLTDPLQLAPAFFEQGGFGSYSVTANANGLSIADGTVIAPVAQNLLLGGSYAQQPSGSDIYGISSLVTLPNGQRAPVNLTLKSVSSSPSLSAFGPATGVLTVGSGARISGDTGASLTLQADQRVDVEGTLSAPAGRISVSLAALKSVLQDPGFEPGQSVWLGAHSALLATGVTQLVPNALDLRQGQVLSGGTVTLDAQRGYVIAQQGAAVDVSGTTGTLDLSQGNGSYQTTRLASAGGTVNINAAEGILWDGSLAAQPGAAGVSGGTLNVTLTRAKAGLGCDTSGCSAAFINPFPTNDRTIVLQNGVATMPASLKSGDAIDPSLNGQAQLDTALLDNSGFDNVNLTSDRTIQFRDNTALTLRGSLRLDAPQLVVANGSTVNLAANYIGIGASEPTLDVSYQDLAAPAAPTPGNGSLNAQARMIELVGNISVSGVADTQLRSSGDLRLRGVLDNANQRQALDGSWQTVGDLILQANQIYPTTFSNYTVSLQDAGSTLTIQPAGAPTPVLSAGGTLTFDAPNIVNDGVIKAPLGTINLGTDRTVDLTLAPGSLTSTSADGQTIPFGIVQNGSAWSYDLNGYQASFPAPPAKSINLNGGNVNVANGATLGVSGGGDLFAYEFVQGPGGSKDVLSAANAPNGYAVLPSLNGASFAPFDQQYYFGSALQPGSSIYLSGGGGLPAGTYALLPARYALLPGAYLVTAVPGYQDLPPGGTQYTQLNGASVVPGYYTLGDTGIRSNQRWSGFAVQPGPGTTPSLFASEYDISSANSFYPTAAVAAATAVPRLPIDAGRVAINAAGGLSLDGQLLATPGSITVPASATAAQTTETGRGAQVDIVATHLDVVNSIDPNNSDVQLLASELNSFGAESLLLGATRSAASDGTLLNVGASDVSIGQGVQLTGPELLFAARETVTVASGAQLTAAGKLSNTTQDMLILGRNGQAGAGNGALLRLSVGMQAAIRRENTDGSTGTLDVQGNTLLSTPGSLALDATRDTRSAGTLVVTGSLNLGAAQINLGAVTPGTPGLNLDNGQLANFTQLSELVLHSYSTVNLYGAAALGALDANGKPTLQSLAIESAGLLGMDNNGAAARITAGSITLGNPDEAIAGTGNGGGDLQIRAVGISGTAGGIDLGAGAFTVAGFNTASLSADSRIQAQGKGSLNVAGNLALTTPQLTAVGGSDYGIAARGHTLTIAAPGAADQTIAAPNAGKLALSAATVDIAGRIDLPAGVLAVTADNGITVEGAINAAGAAQDFAGQSRYLPGGEVSLSTASGDIILNAGSSIDVAGATQGGDAGRLSLSAAQGQTRIDRHAQLSGKAAGSYQTGSFVLDEASLSDFSSLNTLLNDSGFTQQRSLRVRSGDVSIAAGDTVQARDFQMMVDQGALDVAGTIDASGTDGGTISLASSGVLTLEQGVLLDAHALGKTVTDSTDPNNPVSLTLGDGGTVSLSTGDAGSLNLVGGTINVTPVDSQSSLRQSQAGQVYLRAPRVGNDVAITTLNTTFANSDKTFSYPGLGNPVNLIDITAEAYRVYNASTINSSLISRITADTASYMANQSATARFGMTNVAAFHLTPGVEIRSSGNLTLASDWNLYQDGRAYNGSVAGVLTLRAAGDVNINKSLSDGFSNVLPSGSFNGGLDNAGNPKPAGATWSYRLIGGADLTSPDALAVAPGAGNVNIGGSQLVRTGNGRIDVAAGNDITLGNQKSVLYTAGTVASLVDGFTAPATFNYATAGGDITLTAQNNVVGASSTQLIGDWLYHQGQTNADGSIAVATSWGLSFANFQQNIGALGGGNVTVNAGNDVTNLSAVIPTTGRLSGVAANNKFWAGTLTILGGGNLAINAGHDVASGVFYVGRGTGQIVAGDALTSGRSQASTPLYTVLALGDARFDVQARNALDLETLFNPTTLPLASTQGSTFGSYYFTYAPDSAVDLQSLVGDIVFHNTNSDIGALVNSTKLNFSSRGASRTMLSVYPGTLTATAYQGDIVSQGGMQLFPSAKGSLALLAGGDIIAADSIILSDVDPGKLPQAATPTKNIGIAVAPLTLNGSASHAPVPVHNQPGNPDLQPVTIVAGGDLGGTFTLAKAAQLYAGHDIRDLNLTVQNLRSSDITRVVAGRDIVYSLLYGSTGTLEANDNGISVAGPGALQVQAGGTIDLGSSRGIVTTGNYNNANLPAGGASITIAAGITPTPNYGAFMARVLDPAVLPSPSDPNYAVSYKYVSELTAYMTAYENLSAGSLSNAQAYADFKSLPEAKQVQFLQPLTREVFIDRYLDPAVAGTSYSSGSKIQNSGKYYGTDPSGNGQYLTDYMTAYEGKASGQLSDAQALANFRALPAEAQQQFMVQVFYDELRATGRAHTANGFDYQRGYDAINALFPAGNYQGDLNLYFSTIRTEAGGNIDLLVPGGLVNAGLANPPSGLATIKGPSDLGIVAQGSGDISAFVKGDFLVNQSRVFTLLGGDILIWSSYGNIDAGRGAKTAITAPPPSVTTDANGNTTFTYQGAATGSGIREILTNLDIKPGDVDLIAPNGEVNAGDAGIGSAGNLNIAAQQVVGADNIQVGGVSTGLPVADTTAVSAGISGASNLAAGNSVADSVAKNLGGGAANSALASVSVDVLGFGDCADSQDCSQ